MLDPGCFRELLATIDASLARADLEAHLIALVFSSSRHGTDGGLDALVEQCRSTLTKNAGSGTSSGPQDIAVAGVRMALGYPTAVPASAMVGLLRKELSREPLPPAACAKDDEQILIGVAAGIGAAGTSLSGALTSLIHGRGASPTFRQGAIDLWAQSLAGGSVHLSEDSATSIYEYLIQRRDSRRAGASEDDVVALWLSTRLLEAPWTPTDTQVQQIGAAQNTLRRAVIADVARQEFQSGLDAAFAFDGIVSSLNASLARPSTLEQILGVIDAFPSSAEVLRHRQRGRRGFEIADEYDVQDLFRALVLPVVRDLVPEDPASKVAGRSSRLDFVSRKQRTGFEIKHLKSPADRDRVREEVLLDERVYQAHPYIETVVVFIADPSVYLPLADREPFEGDLSQTVTVGDRTVRYVVRVR